MGVPPRSSIAVGPSGNSCERMLNIFVTARFKELLATLRAFSTLWLHTKTSSSNRYDHDAYDFS